MHLWLWEIRKSPKNGLVNVGITKPDAVKQVWTANILPPQKCLKPYTEGLDYVKEKRLERNNLWSTKRYGTTDFGNARFLNPLSQYAICCANRIGFVQGWAFKRLDKPYCYGLSGKKSHKVILFGREDTEYEDKHPFKAKKWRFLYRVLLLNSMKALIRKNLSELRKFNKASLLDLCE